MYVNIWFINTSIDLSFDFHFLFIFTFLSGTSEKDVVQAFFRRIRERLEYRRSLLVVAVENNIANECSHICKFAEDFSPCQFLCGDPDATGGASYASSQNNNHEGLGIRTDLYSKCNYYTCSSRLVYTARVRIHERVVGANPAADIAELRAQLARTKLFVKATEDDAFQEPKYGITGKEGTLQDDLAVAFSICAYVATALDRNRSFCAVCSQYNYRQLTEFFTPKQLTVSSSCASSSSSTFGTSSISSGGSIYPASCSSSSSSGARRSN
jgi:hypothetical protein